ncbi:MAG: TatD family hydrolase, partial [Muribaculaceae bacterium]|nr:TatD family hydrolase [Muribaculaceae bacterium]
MTHTFFDSHSHLYDEAFADGHDDAVRRAIDAGVTQIMLPACELTDMDAIGRLVREFPGHVFGAAGIHPENLPEQSLTDSHLQCLADYIAANRGALHAVGEIGIDLYWDDSRLDDQRRAFRRQCEIAIDAGLPVIIHCRNALAHVLDVIASLPAVPRGVFHCFDGTVADVEAIRRAGDFYFGIGGIVTFKKSTLPQVLPAIPADRLLLETDSPYLAPVPMRGKRNESAYLTHTAQTVAEVLG